MRKGKGLDTILSLKTNPNSRGILLKILSKCIPIPIYGKIRVTHLRTVFVWTLGAFKSTF